MSKTIPLSRRYTIGSAVFDSLTFREPKLADYRRLGPVTELQRGLRVRYSDAIWGYAEDLVEVVPAGALNELDIVDALDVEDAIVGFFTEANKARALRANSSSGSAGAPPT